MDRLTFHIALAGNPNCGKTTLFNLLTGSTQYVGNWAGVTVEKKEGAYRTKDLDVRVIDLPGIYSLSPYSPEEIVSRNYILDEKPELIINIIDATNLERNLYLTTQLCELNVPMIVALNMYDLLKKRGITLDIDALEREFKVPFFPIAASKDMGVDEMMHMAVHILHDSAHTMLEHIAEYGHRDDLSELQRTDAIHMAVHSAHSGLHTTKHPYYHMAVRNFYSPQLTEVFSELEVLLEDYRPEGIRPRFMAIKFFEGDELLKQKLKLPPDVAQQAEKACQKIRLSENTDRQMIIADQRYRFICSACENAMTRKHPAGTPTLSDKIDRIVTNRILAIPVFLLIMLLIFHITFSSSLFGLPIPSPGVFLRDLVASLFDRLGTWTSLLLTRLNASAWVNGLLVDGIIGGVGSVISFAPQILLLFLFLSILEDSGYMARAAFILDRPAQKIGLSGRSFMPLLMGFGCSVPAIMGCRTLESDRDRRLTMTLVPFMSCGAKMPIYLMITSAFFPVHADIAVFCIYLLGIVTAVLSGLLLKSTVMRAKPMSFVMELPAYHLPGIKSLSLHLWDKLRDFLVRAGTVILGATIIIWLLANFSFSFHQVEWGSVESMLGRIGSWLAVIFRPLGFASGADGWKAVVAVLSGFVAKEAVVSSSQLLYGGVLPFTQLTGFCFMAFNLLTVPCMASVAALRGEMRNAKHTLFTLFYWFATSWIITFLIYQIGRLLWH